MKKIFFWWVLLFSSVYSQWQKINSIPDISANSIYISGSRIYVGGGGGRFFISDNGGSTWTEKNSNTVGSEAIAVKDNYIFIATGTSFQGVARSTDGGTTWSFTNTGLSPGSDWFNDLAFVGTRLFLATSNGLYYTDNYGAAWTKASYAWINSNIQALYSSGGILYVATSHPKEVYSTSNQGATWTRLTDSGLTSSNFIKTISVIDNTIFLGHWGSGVLSMPVGGGTWALNSAGLPATTYTRTVDGTGPNIFIGTHGQGIFYSTNRGQSWSSINTGLPHLFFNTIRISSNYIYATTSAGFDGLWRRPLTDFFVGVDDSKDQLPLDYKLFQNYPNPFNPITTINYRIARGEHVTLTIYDPLGREVETLLNEYKQPGYYTVQFTPGSAIASGNYYYRLRAGHFSQTKKMVYIK